MELEWIDDPDNTIPGIVTNTKVENLNGGAMITYDLPDDDDLLGVKAVYNIREGEEHEAFSSIYIDTITLFGFGEALKEYSVKLITMDKSRNESAPVEVKINPLDPPVVLIRQSLDVKAVRGGIAATWENEFKEEIAVLFYTGDTLGDWNLYDTKFSNGANGRAAIRGLADVEQSFKIEIRDKWDNYSVPLDTILTPLFEERIYGRTEDGEYIWEQFGFQNRTAAYRGDCISPTTDATHKFYYIHDGHGLGVDEKWEASEIGLLRRFVPTWPDDSYIVWPFYFTIDMGRKASYSRFRMVQTKMHQVLPMDFEIWATNDPKQPYEVGNGSREDNLKFWTEWPEVEGTDEWKNDWVKIATCPPVILPSGTTIWDNEGLTNEDMEYLKEGFEWEMNDAAFDSTYRYLRFVVYECLRKGWSQIELGELKVWGELDDSEE